MGDVGEEEETVDSVGAAIGRAEQQRFGTPMEVGAALANLESKLFGGAQNHPLIERYALIRRLGSGAFGEVYLAHDPRLDRKVAIKLLRAVAPDPAEAQRRLDREAKSLARSPHPNVVAVYDVGTCETDFSSEPTLFVVMEYVEGPTLDVWLREHRDWREVLATFLAAGRGLAAAHAVGVTHRDFKPANVIVGDDGRVRVVDFGLAGETQSRVTHDGSSDDCSEQSQTFEGWVVGTPAYMAPEQHEGKTAGPRGDQFSFCAALWLGLFGQLPFAGESTQALRLAKQLETPARPLGATAPRWLEEILRRGLSTAPNERWDSMDELLSLLARGVDRQHRRTRTFAVAAALVVTSAGVGGLWSGQPDRCNPDRALGDAWEQPRIDAAEQALLDTGVAHAEETWLRAKQDLDTYADAWKDAFQGACEASSIEHEEWERWELREQSHLRLSCLRRARTHFDAVSKTLTGVDAEAVTRVPFVVAGLVPLQSCEDEEALRLRALAPPEPRHASQVADIRSAIATGEAEIAAGHYGKAEDVLLDASKQSAEIGYQPVVAETDYMLGRALEKRGQFDEATEALERSLRVATRIGHRAVMQRSSTLLVGVAGAKQHNLERAKPYVDIALASSDSDLERAHVHHNFGGALYKDGQLDEARAELSQADELRDSALPPGHPRRLGSRRLIAAILAAQGDYAGAEREHRELVALTIEALGPNHPMVGGAHNSLGNALYYQGRYKEAERVYRRGLGVRQRALGLEHPDVAMSLSNVANALHGLGEYRRAIAMNTTALEIYETAFGRDHSLVAETINDRARTHYVLEQYALAESGFREAVEIKTRTLRPNHPSLNIALSNLATVLEAQGKREEAVAVYRKALALVGDDASPDRFSVRLNLANALVEAGHRDQALEMARRAWDDQEHIETKEADRGFAAFVLARALDLADAEDERGTPEQLAVAAIGHYERTTPAQTDRVAEIREWLDARDSH